MSNNTNSKRIIDSLRSIISKYTDISSANAQEFIDKVTPLREYWTELAQPTDYLDFENLYLSLSLSYSLLGETNKAIDTLKEGISSLCRITQYEYPNKGTMYYNLGIYLSQCNRDKEALDAFRHYVFYSSITHNKYSNVPLYSFRKINKYTLSDLKNNTITLCDPHSFDDPVDSLVYTWLDKAKKSKISPEELKCVELQEKAFSNARIRCFVHKDTLPKGIKDIPQSKNPDKKPEISNLIMWPTYANDHKGICIEYVIPSKYQLEHIDEEYLMFLRDVDYEPNVTLNNTEITLEQAFFTKSKEWEFEQETRLFYYSIKETPKFKEFHLEENCIKKVYFGYRCTDKDKKKVLKAIVKNKDIEFYQMKYSDNDIYLMEGVKFDAEEWLRNNSTWFERLFKR